jgi:hypothetical protein
MEIAETSRNRPLALERTDDLAESPLRTLPSSRYSGIFDRESEAKTAKFAERLSLGMQNDGA